MAFRISFVPDVKEVLRGTEAMQKGFDQTADSLDDLARDAKNSSSKVEKSLDDIGDAAKDAGNKIERELEGAAKDAGGEADKLERKFRDAFDEVKRDSKRAGDDLGDNIKRGTRDAEDGLSNFRDEADQTARESAASFDGSADSIVDAFQETAANAFSGFGPAAGIAGLAMAAGIGALWTSITEGADKSKEAIASMYEDMLESGQDFLSENAIQERVSAIVQGAEDAAIGYSELQGLAEKAGVSVQTMLLAWAGDQESINRVLQATDDKLDDVGDKFANGDITNAEFTGTRYQLTDLKDRLGDVANQLDIATDGANVTKQTMTLLGQTRVDIPVDADTGRAHQKLDNLGRVIGGTKGNIPVDAVASTSQFQQEADRAARSVRPPTIVMQAAVGIQRRV